MSSDDPNSLSSQELEERFDLLASDAKEYAIFLVSSTGHLINWNSGAERTYGYQAPEIIGQHFSRFFSPEDILTGQPEHELNKALVDGRVDSDCWQVRKDGTRFWCRATVTPLLDEYKQVRSFARVMHDLTDSEAMEAQRKRADGLAEANRSKEEFMALLSHELRSPLSPILNALNILRQMKTNDPIIEQAGNIIDRQVGADGAPRGRPAGHHPHYQGKIAADQRARSNCASSPTVPPRRVRPLMDARKHEFSVSLPTQPIWVEADPARLEQIVVNLLNNAAKYTDTGGLIRMTVSQEGGRGRDPRAGQRRRHRPGDSSPTSSSCSPRSTARSAGLTAAWASGWLSLATWSRCTTAGCRRSARGLGKGSEFTIKLPVLSNHPCLRPVPFWSRVRRQAAPCTCWSWKIMSMLLTA